MGFRPRTWHVKGSGDYKRKREFGGWQLVGSVGRQYESGTLARQPPTREEPPRSCLALCVSPPLPPGSLDSVCGPPWGRQGSSCVSPPPGCHKAIPAWCCVCQGVPQSTGSVVLTRVPSDAVCVYSTVPLVVRKVPVPLSLPWPLPLPHVAGGHTSAVPLHLCQ